MSRRKLSEIKELLDAKAEYYESPEFIHTDPISIPRHFSKKEDIEIAGFLTAIIAWGQRKTIIRNALDLMDRMGGRPHEWLLNSSEKDFQNFSDFKHRTFNGDDCNFFMQRLASLYKAGDGLEGLFARAFGETTHMGEAIAQFKLDFFSPEHLRRTEKHLPNPLTGSAAKRFNMFLRWMIRSADKGVDFGLWSSVPSSALVVPLDVHTGNVARNLGLISRKQNDWKAVEEMMKRLRKFDLEDPAKYDFALFGMGVFEGERFMK